MMRLTEDFNWYDLCLVCLGIGVEIGVFWLITGILG